MFQIDALSRKPVYEQLVEQTERFVLSGTLKPGDQLPSVRNLSVQLSINPNTIQKAYVELERRGLTVSVAGKGCFIRSRVDDAVRRYQEKKLAELEDLLKELKTSGLSREDLERFIDEHYGKEAEIKCLRQRT